MWYFENVDSIHFFDKYQRFEYRLIFSIHRFLKTHGFPYLWALFWTLLIFNYPFYINSYIVKDLDTFNHFSSSIFAESYCFGSSSILDDSSLGGYAGFSSFFGSGLGAGLLMTFLAFSEISLALSFKFATVITGSSHLGIEL